MNRYSLPERSWPAGDRQLWEQAQRKGDVIDPDGRAARWRPATRRQVAKGYALWLGFLTTSGILDGSPDQRVTKDALRSYIVQLRQRNLSSTTIASRVTDLYEALRVMVPDADLTLLRQTKDRLSRTASPRRNKQARIVATSELRRLATEYLAALPQMPCQTERMRASWFRDGVLMLLLTSRPIRLRNLASIVIDRHLLKQGNHYALAFTAEETKDYQPLNFPCPPEFTPWLEHYLNHDRPLLLRGMPTQRLWLSMRGQRLSAQAIYIAVCKLTKRLTGRPINPHLFRDCLVSEMAERAPEQLSAASRILGHASLSMTNKHYNQAQMLSAGKAHQKAVMETFEELEAES